MDRPISFRKRFRLKRPRRGGKKATVHVIQLGGRDPMEQVGRSGSLRKAITKARKEFNRRLALDEVDFAVVVELPMQGVFRRRVLQLTAYTIEIEVVNRLNKAAFRYNPQVAKNADSATDSV